LEYYATHISLNAGTADAHQDSRSHKFPMCKVRSFELRQTYRARRFKWGRQTLIRPSSMPPRSVFHSSPASPSSSAFSVRSAYSALNAFLCPPHFRRKSNVSPPSTGPVHNPFLSPTYAKTRGYTYPKNVGAPTFLIFHPVFCSFSDSTHRIRQEGWLKRPALHGRMRKREIADLGLGGIGGGGDVAGRVVGGDDFFEGWLHVVEQGLDAPG